MNEEFNKFNMLQTGERRKICELLEKEFNKGLPEAESKIWHRSPTWFLDKNPIVAYNPLKDCIRILFWSGQSFDEEKLNACGSFKAAEIRYTALSEINSTDIQRWLKKARDIQWDYKNIVKNRGVLNRLK